jgi:hypothetical protein
MSFVIRREADGLYSKGRSWTEQSWVEDLQGARVYPSTGAARNSIKRLCGGRWNRKAMDEASVGIVEVRLVEVSDE